MIDNVSVQQISVHFLHYHRPKAYQWVYMNNFWNSTLEEKLEGCGIYTEAVQSEFISL